MSPFSFVHVITQMPDADAVVLLSCALLSCVATSASVLEEGGVSASSVAVGAPMTCPAIVAAAHTTVGTTHNNFILFSNSGSSGMALAPPTDGNALATLTVRMIDFCKGEDSSRRLCFSCDNDAG